MEAVTVTPRRPRLLVRSGVAGPDNTLRAGLAPYKLTFNGMRLLPDRLVGGENKGWECMLPGLQVERPVWGGNAFFVHIWQFLTATEFVLRYHQRQQTKRVSEGSSRCRTWPQCATTAASSIPSSISASSSSARSRAISTMAA